MAQISFKRHRFPPEVIRHAVWLYFRFTLSFRDVEEMLAQRGIDVSYETIRAWTVKFGPQIAARQLDRGEVDRKHDCKPGRLARVDYHRRLPWLPEGAETPEVRRNSPGWPAAREQ